MYLTTIINFLDQDENAIILEQEAISTYTTLPGVRLKSLVYMDNLGYRYYKNNSRNNKIYLVCENQKNRTEFCPTTAIISVDMKENWIRTNRNHNHYPPVVDIPMVHLRRSIGLAGTSTGRTSNSIRNIYNNEIIANPDGARNYTFLQSQASVQRMRHCRRPPNPDTIEDLAGILNEHMAYASTLQHPPSRFFQQLFEAEGETVGLVFFNLDAIEKYRNELLSVRVAGIDGTFKTVPKRPSQLTNGCLLTFHVLFHNVSFPMVYALTSKMTQATYESFFHIVLRILPLNYAQLTIVTDYERGLMNAVRSIFNESNLQGCWFHFCQAVIRYCRRTLNSVFHLFQNSPEANRVLRMVLALPHLPAEVHPECQFTMAEGFNTIIEYANGIEEISERLQGFLIGYIQQFWFNQIGASCISVFGSDIRTNNYLESFHSTLLSQLGRHPNIWDYMPRLLSIENQYYIEMDQARRNLTIRNNTTRVRRAETSSNIRHYIQLLNEEQDILMFLRRAGHTMDGYNERQLGPRPLEP
ncbi:unnamed protein product [Macrosiphum euphorbiae]|nr:unnamed protein product [Macrosiphum euphorbiae]